MCVRYCILNFIYNRLPEDEPSSAKHVEKRKIKIEILVYKMCISLVYIA